MPFASIGRSTPAVVFIAMLLVAASLLWGVYDNYVSVSSFQKELAAHAAQDAAQEIADIIQGKRVDVARLAEGRGTILARLAARPGDRELQAYLTNLLRERFPEYYAFSLATPAGELPTDLGEDISDVCRQDLRRFAAGDTPYRPYVHPTPGHYHYDIMVRWRDGYDNGILFISFTLDRLAVELRSNQVPGHRLSLVRANAAGLIEITAEGGRDRLGEHMHMTGAELERNAAMGASASVQGTDWLVVDIPDARLLEEPLTKMYWQAAGIVGVFLILGGGAGALCPAGYAAPGRTCGAPGETSAEPGATGQGTHP